jgi:hypothetical protein
MNTALRTLILYRPPTPIIWFAAIPTFQTQSLIHHHNFIFDNTIYHHNHRKFRHVCSSSHQATHAPDYRSDKPANRSYMDGRPQPRTINRIKQTIEPAGALNSYLKPGTEQNRAAKRPERNQRRPYLAGEPGDRSEARRRRHGGDRVLALVVLSSPPPVVPGDRILFLLFCWRPWTFMRVPFPFGWRRWGRANINL